MKKYNAPIVFVMNVEAEDILTLSVMAKGPGTSDSWGTGKDNENEVF